MHRRGKRLELFLDAEHRLSSRLAALTAAGRPAGKNAVCVL